ncbi:ABC transporter ATP-binding protein [Rhodopirellula sp. MGV]|uniref:ABC transporter ATP-binding protein n=1 Tax=Rhodopirellula sp. MGV TaxID=2023130 RepID=UPI0018E99BBA|nr:ABC transporter ATP-binding protein [Rhodopirellula sp. MGV]
MNGLPLEVVGLCKCFGKTEALRGASFELRQGERLALLGPNGAGKSTMIRTLAARSVPDKGEVRVFGEPGRSAVARQLIGWIPQDLAIYGDLTARENMMAFAKFHGVPRRELKQRVQWALQWTGLHDRANHLVRTFSGGMKRRVNLACGVLHQPKILLLDEPTVGVDPQSRQRIFEMLDELSAAGTSLLLTTHHLDEAQDRSDRLLIMDAGRIIADGTIDELVDQTVGRSRLVRLRLDRQIHSAFRLPHHLSNHSGVQDSGDSDMTRIIDRTVETRISDVDRQLTQLIDSVHRQGYHVVDLDVQALSLHHVFLHLTGNKLRD